MREGIHDVVTESTKRR